MTVNDLHKTLGEAIAQGRGGDLVVQAKDAEGNGFKPTRDVMIGHRFDQADDAAGSTARMGDRGVPALVLWP